MCSVGVQVRRLITNPTVKHSFSQLLQRSGNEKADKQLVAQLADLLEKVRGHRGGCNATR